MPDDGGKPGGSDRPPGSYRTFATPNSAVNLNTLLENQLKDGYELKALSKDFVVVYREDKPEHHLI